MVRGTARPLWRAVVLSFQRLIEPRPVMLGGRRERDEHQRLVFEVVRDGAQHLERGRALDLEHHRAPRLGDHLQRHQQATGR
jgi:hypothetical protein